MSAQLVKSILMVLAVTAGACAEFVWPSGSLHDILLVIASYKVGLVTVPKAFARAKLDPLR